MTSDHNPLDPDDVLAERVRIQLQQFPNAFRDIGASGALRSLFRSKATLDGPTIGQQPEVFTEEHLIKPALRGLGYEDQIVGGGEAGDPSFRQRPSTSSTVEANRPDFLLDEVDRELTCILEAKAANREQFDDGPTDASDDVEAYLAENTWSKYLDDTDRYLVAIATDGLRWRLWAKDVRNDETSGPAAEADLEPAVRALARSVDAVEGEPDLSHKEVRDRIREDFVPVFSARHLPNFVREEFE